MKGLQRQLALSSQCMPKHAAEGTVMLYIQEVNLLIAISGVPSTEEWQLKLHFCVQPNEHTLKSSAANALLTQVPKSSAQHSVM
jgi:hypothetical protein